jgi:hypothetical protein
MTKGERDELGRLIKARARVAKASIEQREAEILADFERQLATTYTVSDAKWEDLTGTAQEAVRKADAELAQRCRDLGVPEEFRPRMSFGWWERGENADAKRRTELRRVAMTRLDAMKKQARVAIDTKALDGLTALAAGALESAAAKAFLASMPTVEALMPILDAASLAPRLMLLNHEE